MNRDCATLLMYHTEVETYRFDLSFKGELVENSVDAFDVANTILATSLSLQEIATVELDPILAKELKLNISAFKEGSLVTEFMYLLGTAALTGPTLIPYAKSAVETSKVVLDGLSTYIELKKLLKGKPPKTAKATEAGRIEITAGDNSVINVTYNDFRLLQSRTLEKNIAKAYSPLRKEDSPISSIEIEGKAKEDDLMIEVSREEAPYLDSLESFQILPTVRYKGVVTKIDSKVRSGYINLGARRVPFAWGPQLTDQQFVMLVESLKRKIQIYIIGDVTMDYEGNPRSIEIKEVESEIQLF